MHKKIWKTEAASISEKKFIKPYKKLGGTLVVE